MLRGHRRGWLAGTALGVTQEMPHARQGYSPLCSGDTAGRSTGLSNLLIGQCQETQVQVRQGSREAHGTRVLNSYTAWNSHREVTNRKVMLLLAPREQLSTVDLNTHADLAWIPTAPSAWVLEGR